MFKIVFFARLSKTMARTLTTKKPATVTQLVHSL